MFRRCLGLLLLFRSFGMVYAQAPKPEPDVIIFTNGDKLVGHFESATAATVTFKSDMVGEVKVDWKKIKELRSSAKFAVIPKGVKIKDHQVAGIAQGPVNMADQKVDVASAPPQSIPLGNVSNIVSQASFEKAVNDQNNFFHNWAGTVTAGASLVEATQDSETFTGAISLVRAIPTENWIEPRNRTLIDFSESYGTISQPGTPTVKTDIYHADAERDEYFENRVYGFGRAAFDHNFSQGLDLQQSYSGGIGWTVIKKSNESLDLKGSMSYINQQFAEASANQSLIGSTFAETYLRTLLHGITFHENLSVTPAWNNTSAYSAIANAGVGLPAYKRLTVSLNAIDAFLNDPAPGFRKNSFQFTLGLTYSLR